MVKNKLGKTIVLWEGKKCGKGFFVKKYGFEIFLLGKKVFGKKMFFMKKIKCI